MFVCIAFISGLLLSNQSPINTRLGERLHSPFIAASISFAIGTIFLGIITWSQLGYLFPSVNFITNHPAWIWLGGVLGAVFLTSNILLFPRIGAVRTVVLPLIGQIVMGIAIDTFGWFGATQTVFSWLQAAGLLIMFAGILLTVSPNKTTLADSKTSDASMIPWMIWAIIIGAFSATQQAINGHLGTLLKSSVQAAFLSFGIGMILIMIITIFIVHDWPTRQDFLKVEPWVYVGGILGALFVLTTVISVPQIGTGLTIMMALIGQLIGSILVQQFGWWHSKKSRVQGRQLLGILILTVGIALIKLVAI